MTELVRAAGDLTGLEHRRNLAASWTRDAALGFVTPLVIAPGPGVTSNPIAATGMNSFMVLAEVAAPVAGTLIVVVNIVRPTDGTLWPSISAGNASTAAGGWVVIPFGSAGRDQTTQAQGFCSLMFAFTLIKSGAGNVTLNNVRLQSMTRP